MRKPNCTRHLTELSGGHTPKTHATMPIPHAQDERFGSELTLTAHSLPNRKGLTVMKNG